MNPGFARTSAILLALALGALVSPAHVLAGAIPWLVVTMLFLVFLQTHFVRSSLQPSHFVLLAANLFLGFASFGFGWLLGGRDLALAAFFAGITPTATAAPVIISFLRGQVEYVVAAFVLTNCVIAALLPVLLPLVLGHRTPEAFTQVAGSVGMVVFAPMAAAALVRRVHPAAVAWPGRCRNFSFGLWVTAIFLITANASHFLRHEVRTPPGVVVRIAAVTAIVCAVNFAVGRWIGGRRFPQEASQSLGQKNTTFTIYLALIYASPLVALGPTFYVIWHNLWNCWQLHRASVPPRPGRTN